MIRDTFEGLVYVGNPAKPLTNTTSYKTFKVMEEVTPLSSLEQKMVSAVVSEGLK